MSLFAALLDSAPDAIVLVDSDGKIVLANRRTQELFGYQPGEMVGQEVELLVPPRFRAVHLAHRVGYAADPRTREMGVGLELYGQRKDGSQFPVEISLSPMAEGTEELVVTIIRDGSDRRAAEHERLELAREQAAHAEAEAGRARLASILGEIDVIVWESDARRRRFSFVSRRAAAERRACDTSTAGSSPRSGRTSTTRLTVTRISICTPSPSTSSTSTAAR
jgi:PAS domain S-box-containing protein